jgi:urease accessory protein
MTLPNRPLAGQQSAEGREPGSGHIHLVPGARFATSRASYPLKLLSPAPLSSQPPNLATCYTLAYGGGLVAGDVISLRVELDEGCGLVMLTQGSTKVFKKRPGIRPQSHTLRQSSSPSADHWTAVQRLHVTLKSDCLILVMPDSVSPFRDSRYSQLQRFVLPACGTGSALILDWVNSGRGQQQGYSGASNTAEVWSMARYASTNEVLIGDKTVMRERMILDNSLLPNPRSRPNDLSSIAKHLAPYNVYATVLIIGPKLQPLLEYLRIMVDKVQQFQLQRPPKLTWAFSPVEAGKGGVVRIAAVEVEDVKMWLRQTLSNGGVRDLVGEGLWPRVI